MNTNISPDPTPVFFLFIIVIFFILSAVDRDSTIAWLLKWIVILLVVLIFLLILIKAVTASILKVKLRN